MPIVYPAHLPSACYLPVAGNLPHLAGTLDDLLNIRSAANVRAAASMQDKMILAIFVACIQREVADRVREPEH